MSSLEKRVLFLSEAIGSGHVKAAEAIAKALTTADPEIKTLRVDAFKYVNRLLNKIFVGTYLEIIRFTPQVYGFLYERAELSNDEKGVISDFNRIINTLIATKLKNLIYDFNPDAIVCTHPFPCGVVSVMKDKGKISAPIYGVITDFTVHPFWMYSNIERYFVASEKVANDFIVKGLKPDRVDITGIPVGEVFSAKASKNELREQYGLDQKAFVILVMGGGFGIGGFDEIMRALSMTYSNIHAVFIAGHNKSLKIKLEKETKELGISRTVVGYTDAIHDYMKMADLLVTKPGGLTCSEALSCELPMLLFEPIPGQEERNAEYLMHTCSAMRVDDVETLARMIDWLANDRSKLESMSRYALTAAKPEAATAIAERIIQRIC